jgi:predicted CXXCH cytochrome family protein
MTCHDGAIAGDAGGHQTRRLAFDGSTEHPVGVELRDRNVGQPDEILFVGHSALDPRIRLFDGKVGCGSCHNQYSSRESLLVMSNHQSRLCLACHIE